MEYNLQILKKKKEELKEKKEKYKIDLDLFSKFKKLKESNQNFEIPELFIDKFKIMTALEDTDSLNMENFYKNYENIPKSSFDGLFSGNGKKRELLEINDYILNKNKKVVM